MDPTQRIATTAALLLLLLAGTAPGALAQTAGTCSLGSAQSTLNINNVQASIFNTGSLFFGGSTTNGDGYYVPKAALRSPVYASGLWVGGQINGQLRLAGSRYTNFNFWPGPLGDDGRPVNPNNCAPFDRIYSVTRNDILDYEGGGAAAADLAEWPAQLGAPVVDGDGIEGNYDLAAGDRPDIIGDQGIWWVMNDVGATHSGSGTDPLGIEVQTLAWAFSRADALGNTTFYKYRIINKGSQPITQTYVTIFSDPDLGNAGDDYVAYDADLGMGYVYNGDNDDEGATGYGVPPAMGYDFFQGPVNAAGDTLAASAFSYFINGSPSTTTGDPSLAPIMYNYQQGLWGDGSPMRASGTGYQQPNSSPITTFAFTGNPVTNQAWSELNPGPGLPANAVGDRRFLISTGPFRLEPNVPQDIVFGIVFAQGSSNLASISALRAADRLAQQAYDIDFRLAPPPPPPPLCTEQTSGSGQCAEAVAQSGQVTLVWGYPPSNPNYLGRFEVTDQLLAGQDVDDDTYNFEGFNIYRYPTSSFQTDQRQLIATFDKVNGVTTVVDTVFDAELGRNALAITARGSDNGLQYSLVLDGLTNYTDYFYGITAYAYNAESSPKVNESSATLVVARPAGLTSGIQAQSINGDSLAVTAVMQRGEGRVQAVVSDPTRITGHTYEVRLFNPVNADGTVNTDLLTYSIVDVTTGEVRLDGQAYYLQTGGEDGGEALEVGTNIAIVDGFSFTILGPEPGFNTFLVTQNASGPLNPPEYAAATGPDFGSPGFPNTLADLTVLPDRPSEGQQVGPAEWFIQQGSTPTNSSYATWLSLVLRNDNLSRIGASDYEWRFTPGQALNFSTGDVIDVPFQLWNAGVGTPDDPSDDVRLVPEVLDDFPEASAPLGGFNLGNVDHAVSGSNNDPFTDRLYWYNPADMTPGEAGYNAVIAGGDTGGELFARMVLVNWNGGVVTNPAGYNQQLPEPGTVFRLVTAKPNQAGDVFSINTANFQPTEATVATKEEALERIQVVPNPYLGASTYESGNASRVARFTNLPEEAATIRVFTVAGTLVKTLRKDGRSRSLDWDLTTQNNLPVASGMYLIHIEIEGVGERVLKFGVVQRRTEINVF